MKLRKKIIESKMFKKAKDLLSSKTFIGSFLVALSLWLYVSFNAEYLTFVKLPLTVTLPVDRAKESPLPPTISVEVRGTGWNLFTLMFFNSSARCNIDLSAEMINDDSYLLNRTTIIKSLEYLMNVEPIDVLPETMTVKSGKIGEYSVKVVPDIDIKPREGFDVVGNLNINPRNVRIRGNEKLVGGLKQWKTMPTVVRDVYKPTTVTALLSDTLKKIVQLSPGSVSISFNVEQIGSLTFPNVPIKIRGGSLPENHVLLPSKIDVIIESNIQNLIDIDPDDIIVSLDYKNIISDSTGVLIPDITVGKDVKVLKAEPYYIYHKRYVNSLAEADNYIR